MQERRRYRKAHQVETLIEYVALTKKITLSESAEFLEATQDYLLTHHKENHIKYLVGAGIPVRFHAEFFEYAGFARVLQEDRTARTQKWTSRLLLWVTAFVVVALLSLIMGLLDGYQLREDLNFKCDKNPQSKDCAEFLQTHTFI